MPKQQLPQERRWYVIHTYVGYEDSVAENLRQKVEGLGLENMIFNVLVPKEKKIKIKGGKKQIVEEKIYPGYVFVEMIVTDETWYVVRNTPNVTGFIGAGTTPIPVPEEEMKKLFERIQREEPEFVIDLKEGEMVRIVEGPFKDLEGKVMLVDKEKGKVKVSVNLFGRETPVELDYLQIKRL